MPRFVDTNVPLCAISDDEAESRKRSVAEALLTETDLALSTQVLGDLYVQATRPSRLQPVAHDTAARIIESLTRYRIEPLTYAVVSAALATKQRYDISYRDATIIEAAREAHCAVVSSEDLSDGQDYGGVRVQDPLTQPS